jgi:hypothetical protein
MKEFCNYGVIGVFLVAPVIMHEDGGAIIAVSDTVK